MPTLIILALVQLFPLLYSFYLSLSRISLDLRTELIGLANYHRIVRDPTVRAALWHSVVFTVGGVAGQLVVGLVSALLLNYGLRGQRWMRLAMLIPWVIPTVITALVWRWMLDSHFGVMNDWLVRAGILDSFRSWLGMPDTALAATVLVNVWRGSPFVAVMLLAALQLIPKEHYEAAQVDGAGSFQQFRYITLPGVMYTMALAGTMSGIWSFKEFALIQLLTEGGPAGATEVVGTLVYRMFFQYARFGEAAALGVLVFLVLFVASTYYLRLATRIED
ncbi:carbohydrate ABC transporter permease [Geochorda subterranea]|uniref:Sugar ABC transporter permease n=1 Tax=Geochorda subterranea TaxID=3109564 RepID=A0ABZ1BLH3_9FIRM|nr:sugar ABC transporter permease [Limnochorda sp. LNt]WRP13652.1 sugar ABC transporter permease [Limnochorda sp. LNt]